MDLKGIIAIAGKPGLYKVAAQGRANIIVQSLDTDKKFPAFASDKISALEDISVYTYSKDVPLVEVFTALAEKENFGKSISHKEDAKKLREHLVSFLPDYDAQRVYDADVRKLYQWYNLLIDKELITKEKAEAAKQAKADIDAKTGSEKAEAENTVEATEKPAKAPRKKPAKKAE